MRYLNSATLILALAGAAHAGPLVPGRVLPDATWVVHIDIESMVNSNVGRTILATEIGAEMRNEIETEFGNELGMNPLNDLRSVTIFGHSEEEDQALFLISGTSVIDQVLERIPQEVPNYNAIREGDRVVHTWDEGDGEGADRMYAYAAPGGGANERVVLLSGSLDELRRGMLRIEGGGAEMSPALSNGRLPAPGSFIFVSADELPGMDDADNDASAMLRYARGLVFDAGEQGDELRAAARITTDGVEDATTMLQAVQGMMAVGRMIATSEPEIAPLMKLADGCRATTEGATLVVSLTLDRNVVSSVLTQIAEHEQAQRQEDGAEEQQIREDLKKLEKIEKHEKHEKHKKKKAE